MRLWSVWWSCVEPLRPAFSRGRTFLWFAAAVAAACVRPDLAGVTSFVRALGLRRTCYAGLLAMFHSTGADPDLRFVREIISDRPALKIPSDSTIVKVIEKGFEDLQGKPLERMKARFGSDAADIVKATGMPMPILGPGDEDEATSVGEKLSIEEYLAAVEIYALTAARLLS